jgi:ABC-type transport system involved in cytochrome c biogenesis permease subunit
MATIASGSRDRSEDRNTPVADSNQILAWLGSLKLTVALFSLSLVTVLVGTLAQDEMNMLAVKQRYFLSWIAMLHVDDFFPQSFFPHAEPIPGVIPFPGGALIGLLLMVNLIAAKTTRFRIHSQGGRLTGGLCLIALGVALASLVIVAGHNSDGLQGTPPISYQSLWAAVLAAVTVLGIAAAMTAVRIGEPTFKVILLALAAALGLIVAYALISGFRIGDPGLRIVWQLTKGLGAGVVLLLGCLMVFDKQGGNVTLHLGVGLLMVGQFVFGDRQTEQRLSLVEGQSSNTLVNLDAVEMTFIEQGPDQQLITAVPASRLRQAFGSEQLIQDPALPVDVRVLAFYDNSTLQDVGGENLANKGVGLEVRAVKTSPSGGTDSEMNIASAYVELLDKSTGDALGTHLISQLLSDREMLIPDGKTKDVFDTVTVGEKTYNLGLKFHREVKPYWVQLEDVRRVNYSGTETPRDYSSFVRIIDEQTGEDRKERVWMNNPLRYRGETFYQSNYTPLPGGKEMTGIQVVRNSGWLIPYVACSITALGMLAHFSGTLTRFLRRRERENRKLRADLAELNAAPPSRTPVVACVSVLALLAATMLVPWQAVMHQMRPASRDQHYDFYAAGKIPTQFGGRVMPLDAYARQTLKAISNRESLPLEAAPAGIRNRVGASPAGGGEQTVAAKSPRSDSKKLSAMQWLMEVAIDSRELRFLPMFRVDADEVRSELGLERRQSKLYSLDEIGQQWDRVSKQVDAAVPKQTRDQTFKERKLLELDRRTRQFTLTAAAFRLPTPQEIPAEEFEKVFPGADEQTRQMLALRELQRRLEALKNMSAPAIVAPTSQSAAAAVNDPDWAPFATAVFDHYSDLAKAGSRSEVAARPGIESFSKVIEAYENQDKLAFNAAVDEHLAAVQAYEIPGYDRGLVALERWMQSTWPTGVATLLYLIALVMGLVYFAIDLPRLRQAVWGTLVIAVLIHTVAILCRIAITGRAPVINIYSSAVFIGWAAVLFGLVVERIFKYGIGNVLASAAGVLTLLVAYGLDTGDTMPVLQAVLDTQFWLATHVISVTLGYVATLVAGTLGIGYLIAGWLGKDSRTMHDWYRCGYGAACFGILFSFVGTVLGGLWADDSWGRFWGWDPKENGALLIVIWNALMLHARWDGMVGPRGFANLAIGGNMVTAWSWFGTNELGIGLHSYGFTSGVLMWLTVYMGSQLLFIVADGVLRYLRLGFGPAPAR